MKQHTNFVNAIATAVNKKVPHARIFKRVAGLLTTQGGSTVSGTIKGQADLYGFVKTKHGAIHFEVEAKTGADRMRPEQLLWLKCCQELGSPHLIAHAKKPEDQKEVAAYVAEWVAKIGSP